MSKNNKKFAKLFKQIILLVLIVTMWICSTSCQFVSYMFCELNDAEWESAMNSENFNNVTMETTGKTIKKLDGVFYDDGVALKNDGTDLLLRVIVKLFDNCKKENFDFLIASTYTCEKIEYTFDFVATEIDDGLDVTINAKAENVVIQFYSDKKVGTLICNLSFTIIGDNYEESMNDLPISMLFTNYGTTVVD